MSTAAEVVTAQLNGHPVAVCQPHRRWTAADYTYPAARASDEPEPVLVTVVAPVGLSLDDVAAVLFEYGVPDARLADDSYVRSLVAETVVTKGSNALEDLRCTIGEAFLASEETAHLAYCRARAAAVFAAQPPRARNCAGAGVAR